MGIFSDNVRRYFDHGLITIPCKEKRPILGKDWQQYCLHPPTEEQIDKWETSFKDCDQLGLVMGPTTKLVGFDFDYEWNETKCTLKKAEFEKDRKNVERQILALLPGTPAIKTGKKGWTRLYRIHGDLDNAQCDRHGLRLFDFLAKNKQTIIPPSRYSDDITYRWLGPAVEECFDDIPIITQDVVNELRLVLSDREGFDFEAAGRHGKLFKWLLDVVKVEPDNKKVAEKLLLYDKLINPVPYLADPKHFPRHLTPEQNANNWIIRIRKFVGEGGYKKSPVGRNGWDYFFDHCFPKVKKDIISKYVFFKLNDKEDWTRMDSIEGVLRAYADERGLFSTKTVDQFERWCLEKSKCDFLCDIPEWDGVDRLALFGNSVKSKEFSGPEIADILKHWCSNIFRRVKSPTNQNRCVILKGLQGAGKDFFVRSMLEDFKPYYESTTLPGTQKDALEIASRLLALHIEEFDQTKGMDIAFLKSLITQPSAFFRESYGASPNQKIMRPSFISTANVDDILRDPTGNRRFIVIPLEGIDWGYPTGQSLQIMAQAKHYEASGLFKDLSLELEAKIKVIIDAFTPEDLSVAIVDIYTSKFADLTSINGPFGGKRQLNGIEITEMLGNIARLMQCSLRRVQSSVKANGLSYYTRQGATYFGTRSDADQYRSRMASNPLGDPPVKEW